MTITRKELKQEIEARISIEFATNSEKFYPYTTQTETLNLVRTTANKLFNQYNRHKRLAGCSAGQFQNWCSAKMNDLTGYTELQDTVRFAIQNNIKEIVLK